MRVTLYIAQKKGRYCVLETEQLPAWRFSSTTITTTIIATTATLHVPTPSALFIFLRERNRDEKAATVLSLSRILALLRLDPIPFVAICEAQVKDEDET